MSPIPHESIRLAQKAEKAEIMQKLDKARERERELGGEFDKAIGELNKARGELDKAKDELTEVQMKINKSEEYIAILEEELRSILEQELPSVNSKKRLPRSTPTRKSRSPGGGKKRTRKNK